MAKAVIWDMDGVIVNTRDFHWEATRDFFREHGVEMTKEEFLPTFGVRFEEVIRDWLPGEDGGTELAEMVEHKEGLFRKIAMGHIRSLPGAIKLIKSLRNDGFRLAIGSSTVRENIELVLSELGVKDCFDEIVSAEDVEKGKPDPSMFLEAARRLEVPPSQCVVIEDSLAGVEAAKAGGMKCVAVTNARTAQDLHQADLIVESLEGLGPEDFDRLINGR
jgi:beta-phosphoglucomutase family hydrolase